jgi:RHS repeat-associated protein
VPNDFNGVMTVGSALLYQLQVKLGALAWPGAGPQQVFARLAERTTPALPVTITLLQGNGTGIASRTYSPGTNFADLNPPFILTSAELALISNYADLHLKFIVNISAAIQLVQTTAGSSTGNTINLTWPHPTRDGDFLVAVVADTNMHNAAPPAGWTTAVSHVSDNGEVLIAYIANAPSQTATGTFTGGKFGKLSVVVAEYSVEQSYSGGVLSERRRFYYSSGWHVLEERVGSSTTADRQFVWGLRYIDDLILRDRDSSGDGSLNERLYGLQDPNWNLTAIADSSGALQERYSYDVYGIVNVLTPAFLVRTATQFDWETLYASYRLDGDSGLYQLRHRWLHPLLAGFTTRDTGGSVVETPSLYIYLNDNPTTGTDPKGLQEEPGQPGQCVIKLVCRRTYVVFRHCGVEVTDSSRYTPFHVRYGSCQVLVGRALVRALGPWFTVETWNVPEQFCQCIRRMARFINFEIAPYRYEAPPGNDNCGGQPTCNSNYISKCLLRSCGLGWSTDGKYVPLGWPWGNVSPIGWDHRMKICTSHYLVHYPGAGLYGAPACPTCVCSKWRYIDTEWCGEED